MSSHVQPEELNGKTIREYKVMKPIGSGKFSIVFKAENIENGTPVALKWI